MPLPETGTYPLSNKDVVSFTFDNPQYDVNKPVSVLSLQLSSLVSIMASMFNKFVERMQGRCFLSCAMQGSM